MTLTNREISAKIDIIFGHTAQFQLPAAFANRNASRNFLVAAIRSNDGGEAGARDGGRRISIVSDLLGAGKTFLVEMVQQALDMESPEFLLAGRNSITAMERLASKGPVFIDEWDTKAGPRDFSKGLNWLAEFCGSSDVPIVLMGDYTLKSDVLRDRLGDFATVHYVPMEPLDQTFFRLALKQRILYAFSDRFSAVQMENPETVDEVDASLVHSDIIHSLVPDWTITSATFRDVFRTLHAMAGLLPVDDASCEIGEQEAVRYLEKVDLFGGLDREQEKVVQAIAEVTASAFAGKTPLKPLSLIDLYEMAGASRDIRDFQSSVVNPLARSMVIYAMGVPTISGQAYNRYPEPFLPGSALRLHSMFGRQS